MAGNFLVVSGAKEPPPFSVQTFRNVKSKGCLRASQALQDPKRPRSRALESPWGNDGCPCPPAPPLTSLVAHGVRVWCEQTLGTLLGVSCPGGGGAGRTQRRVQWGRVPLTPGRWGGTTGFNCQGPKSQGRVHLPPGPPPPTPPQQHHRNWGPPNFLPRRPAMGSGKVRGAAEGKGLPGSFRPASRTPGPSPGSPSPFLSARVAAGGLLLSEEPLEGRSHVRLRL